MDLMQYTKTASFLSKLLSDRRSLIKETPTPVKKALPALHGTAHPFPRVTPEEVGVESSKLHDFLEEYSKMTELHPHALMIMKDDGIILETDFYPYHRDMWHVSHSLCKSLTALAIGLCMDDGLLSLDERLVDIFPKRASKFDMARLRDITIRTLLNMSAGVGFNEIASVTEEDWVESFLGSGVKFQPGSKFMYNSMNTYMLSACIREKTGKDMLELVTERLFTPMEITDVYWEKCPKGITKGGWGLYMKIEDLMKFAALLISEGIWNGQKLISAKWIREMTKKQIDTPENKNKFGYGYQVWRSVREDSYQFNGMLGQNLIVFPDIHMAIAVYGGNAEFFPSGAFMALIERHFGRHYHPSITPLKPDRRAYAMLEKLSMGLSLPPKLTSVESKKRMAALLPLMGKRYIFEGANTGILPSFTAVMHGNITEKLTEVRFFAENNLFFAAFEAPLQTISIPFSPDGTAAYFDFCENEEHFEAASIARMTENEDGIPVFKLSIYFLETANVRHIKFFFYRTKTIVRFSEEPAGLDLLETYFPNIEEVINKNKVVKNVFSHLDFGLVEYHVEKLFSPEFEAKEVARQALLSEKSE